MSGTEGTSVTDMFDKAMAGEITQDEFDKYLDEQDSDTGASQPPKSEDVDQEVKVDDQPKENELPKADDTPKQEDAPKAADAPADKAGAADDDTPVVLTKDGKHTIPYDVFVDYRDRAATVEAENKSLRQALSDKDTLLKDFQAAKATDVAEGTTDATDDFLGALGEDYPDAAKMLKGMLDDLKADKSAPSAEPAGEGNAAAMALDAQIAALNPDYLRFKSDPKFWTWFDDQPKAIRDIEGTNDPVKIADVISKYTAALKPADNPATDGDKSEKELREKKEAADKKVAEARAKAEDKSEVNSISDIPGGTPSLSEAERLSGMSNDAYLDMLNDKTPDEIEKILARQL